MQSLIGSAVLRQPDGWYRYCHPQQIISTVRLSEVTAALRVVDEYVERHGFTAVGFVSYEAAPAFDSALQVRADGAFPLVWFGLYRDGQAVPVPLPANPLPMHWLSEMSRNEYESRFGRVKAALRRGASYQVNLSMRLRCADMREPWLWFRRMADHQPTGYSTYIDTGRWVVASVSPELFFKRDGDEVICRPMKGTAPRGADSSQDALQAECLRGAAKERAENLMIVDMIRNDLGRIAPPGGVQATSLFELEGYPSVWQMTSQVRACVDLPTPELFATLFPCASITGAPKVATMALISDLEVSPRRIYTGAVGMMAPGRRARFAVAIRTLLCDTQTGQAEYGVGSGVVWDSQTAAEWDECRLKARPVTDAVEPLYLLETLRWTPQEGFWLLDRHLERLAGAAASFGYPWDPRPVLDALQQAVTAHNHPLRLRVLLAADGAVRVEQAQLQDVPNRPVRLRWAEQPVDSRDPMLAVKTTRRGLYDEALDRVADCDDVILFNERAEVTETTIANLVCELGGRLLTPALSCGLLPGTLRARLLEEGVIEEAVISRTMLREARVVWCINSVRGWRFAELVDDTPVEAQPWDYPRLPTVSPERLT